MLIDTHCHLYLPQFDQDREDCLRSARDVGVKKILLPNIDLDSLEGMQKLCNNTVVDCLPMIGLHPCSVGKDWEAVLASLEVHFEDDLEYCAIGECGLDFYWPEAKAMRGEQELALRRQVAWAKKRKLPLVLHTRDSLEACLDLVETEWEEGLRGVFHCFSGSLDRYKRIRDLNFFIGIGGVATFKNSNVVETLRETGLERVVLETDAPYLSPVPFRGKRNEPSYVDWVAKHLAKELGMDYGEVVAQTGSNAARLFGLGNI